MQPNAELKVSELVSNGPSSGGSKKNQKYSLNVLATSSADYNEVNEGFKCLSSNPINNELICSGSYGTENLDYSILIWKLTQETLANGG